MLAKIDRWRGRGKGKAAVLRVNPVNGGEEAVKGCGGAGGALTIT